MELTNKIAVVTGISKGIGKAITEQLLQKGAKVIGWGRTTPDYDHENLKFFRTDIRNFTEVKDSFGKTLNWIGRDPDILINNSGRGYFSLIEDFTLDQWHELFDINVNGLFYATKMVVPGMKKKGSGHIINISSIAGQQGMAQGSAYSGTKYAVRGISDCLFRELRDFGIKVSCVFPGSTQTDFFKNAAGIDAHEFMMQPEEVASQVIRLLETSDNFIVNEITFRPLQPKGPKK